MALQSQSGDNFQNENHSSVYEDIVNRIAAAIAQLEIHPNITEENVRFVAQLGAKAWELGHYCRQVEGLNVLYDYLCLEPQQRNHKETMKHTQTAIERGCTIPMIDSEGNTVHLLTEDCQKCPELTSCQAEQLKSSVQSEKEKLANRALLFSALSSALVIYLEYRALRNVWNSLKAAEFVLQRSKDEMDVVERTLETLEEELEELRGLIQDYEAEPRQEDFETILITTNTLQGDVAILNMAIHKVEVKVSNGVTSVGQALTSQKLALKSNILHSFMNAWELAQIGASASLPMCLVQGVVVAAYAGLAVLNYQNTVCCQETLKALGERMAEIEGLKSTAQTFATALKEITSWSKGKRRERNSNRRQRHGLVTTANN